MKKPCFLVYVFLALALSVSNAGAVDLTLPGAVHGEEKGVGGFVDNIYRFSLIMGGILAFGAIVYGGIKYVFAAGNPSGQSEGKEWVKSALLGLLLLAGATLVLRTINPNLTSLKLQKLPDPPAVSSQSTGPLINCGGGQCAANQACWNNQCLATINGQIACGADPQGLINGPCPGGASQTCASINGRRSCVSSTISNACSNQYPSGTCIDPNASCQNVGGTYQCVSQETRPPACRNRPAGSCVYIGLNPQPEGCAGYGGILYGGDTCNQRPSAGKEYCYQKYNC